MALDIGPGFQQWIDEHQATPLSDELYLTPEQQFMLVRVADANGTPVIAQLIYNKPTNEIAPFFPATL